MTSRTNTKPFKKGELNIQYLNTYYQDKIVSVQDRGNDVLVQLDTMAIRFRKTPTEFDPYTVVGENAFRCNYCYRKILGNKGSMVIHLRYAHGKEVK